MERRKDTTVKGSKLPRDYLKLVEDIFNKNFKAKLLMTEGKRELFVAFCEIYPDELVMSVSLKNPKTLRMTTCYTSVDYPPAKTKNESGKSTSTTADSVEIAVNQCVDAIASFFVTFFDEERPVDYDVEYRQNWTIVELDKATRVFMKINRDNPELDADADAILAAATEKKAAKKSKKKNDNLH